MLAGVIPNVSTLVLYAVRDWRSRCGEGRIF